MLTWVGWPNGESLVSTQIWSRPKWAKSSQVHVRTSLSRTRFSQTRCYLELKSFSLGCTVSATISCLVHPTTRTLFLCPLECEMAGFNCTLAVCNSDSTEWSTIQRVIAQVISMPIWKYEQDYSPDRTIRYSINGINTVSGQLRPYPSHNPTCYSKLVLLLGQGRGKCAVAQILILIQLMSV